MPDRETERPQHLQAAGETIHELREERHQQLPKRERLVQAIILRLARPSSVLIVIAFMLVWVLLNFTLRPLHRAFDTQTFALLNLISQLVSLVVVLGILSAQHSERTLQEERDRLTLQLTLIIDKKISEALGSLGGASHDAELREPTDLRQAAEVLRKAKEQAGKDQEQRISGDR
jgi:uncharacterized membrane protein